VAAVALGACIIEKHFTLARADGGPDSAFSLEPQEFKTMVDSVRVAEKALGQVRYQATEHEAAGRAFRRSLFVVQDVKVGEVFTRENVRSIRPGQGLAPKHLSEVLGRRAARDIARGTPLTLDMVA
jgi:N-acetylneuraminate synthase